MQCVFCVVCSIFPPLTRYVACVVSLFPSLRRPRHHGATRRRRLRLCIFPQVDQNKLYRIALIINSPLLLGQVRQRPDRRPIRRHRRRRRRRPSSRTVTV